MHTYVRRLRFPVRVARMQPMTRMPRLRVPGSDPWLVDAAWTSPISDEPVDQVLEHFLATRRRLRVDVVLHRPVGDGLERRTLGMDLLAQVTVPLRITLRDELVDA